jgi:hypothetical protein
VLTEAQIIAAVQEELSDLSSLLSPTSMATRWFNEGQARLGWYTHGTEDVTWADGDLFVAFSGQVIEVVEVLYPEDVDERRWRAVQGGLLIEDIEGADGDGSATVIVRTYWPEVDSDTASSLPRQGDAACIAYVLHRFFRRLTANRSVYQRYSTLMGENGVSIDDLSNTADDHYRDYLDLRADLPAEPAAAFYAEG